MEGKVGFIHSDGSERVFETKAIIASHQMYTFDNWKCCYQSSKKGVRAIVKNIYSKASVISNTIKEEV